MSRTAAGRTLDARWPLLERLLLETPPATRLQASFYLPADLPRAAVVGGSMGPERPWTTANDGPLINVSAGRHPESLQVSAGEAVTLRRPPYAWRMRAVVHLGVLCRRVSPYSYLPQGTYRVAAEERGVVRCSGSL
jgi:hypothetical protein